MFENNSTRSFGQHAIRYAQEYSPSPLDDLPLMQSHEPDGFAPFAFSSYLFCGMHDLSLIPGPHGSWLLLPGAGKGRRNDCCDYIILGRKKSITLESNKTKWTTGQS
jgi:hypothetical protein